MKAWDNMLETMETKWKKPAANFAKVNVDFAAFTSTNHYGTGAIIRDEHGQFVAARVQRFVGGISPYLGELQAAKFGIQLAQELGLDSVELEVDAKNIWRSITEGEQDRSYGGNILRDIFAYYMSFRSFKCKFAPRQCNRVADVLANSAKDFQLET